MIPSQVFCRLFHLQTEDGLSGSAFLTEYPGGRALITAKHMCNGERVQTVVIKQAWNDPFEKYAIIDRIGDLDAPGDVAAFDLPESLWPDWYVGEVALDSTDLIYGQDCYLLGYPAGLRSTVTGHENELPLIKKCIISGQTQNDDLRSWVVDTTAIPGFSGGPLVFERGYGSGRYAIAGVINGSLSMEAPSEEHLRESAPRQPSGFSLCLNICHATALWA